MLIAVDNVQAADDNSAAFLAALGQQARRARLMLLVTQTTGDDVVANAPLRAMRKRGARLKLAGLDAARVRRAGQLAVRQRGQHRPPGEAALRQERGQSAAVHGPRAAAGEEARSPSTSTAPGCCRSSSPPTSCRAASKSCWREARRAQPRRAQAVRSAEHSRPSASRSNAASRWSRACDERRSISRSTSWWPSRSCWSKTASYGFRQQALRESVLAQIDEARRKRAAPARSPNAARVGGAPASLADGSGLAPVARGRRAARRRLMAGAAREFLRHQGVESVEQVVHGDRDRARAVREAEALQVRDREHAVSADVAGVLRRLARHARSTASARSTSDSTSPASASRSSSSRFLPDKLALGLGLWRQPRCASCCSSCAG